MGFRVWGLGFGVWGLGVGGWGLGVGGWGLGVGGFGAQPLLSILPKVLADARCGGEEPLNPRP